MSDHTPTPDETAAAEPTLETSADQVPQEEAQPTADAAEATPSGEDAPAAEAADAPEVEAAPVDEEPGLPETIPGDSEPATPESLETPAPEEPEAAPAMAGAEIPPVEEAEAPAAEAAPEAPAAGSVTEAPAAEPAPEAPTAEPAPEAPAAESVPEGEAPAEAAPEAPAESAPEAPAAEAAPAPAAPVPAPPKPTAIPSPAALRKVVHAPVAPAAAHPHSDSAAFGRVDEEGRVFVREGEGEREVGTYVAGNHEEALQYYARKYDEIYASAELLQQRMQLPEVGSREVADGLKTLKEQATEPNVVGDLAALAARVQEIETGLAGKREQEQADRAAAREIAKGEREKIVAEAEKIAAQPSEKVQWKQSGARMRELLEEWKQHQRSGAKLDKPSENELWQRFSHARNRFDKARRVYFAQLDETHAEAKSVKEELVAEAEALQGSTDWGPTATAYKRLMDRWRKAGRASRADDDALWARFKAAQDAFFAAKDEVAAAEDEEYRANLAVKEQLLADAQQILPVKDLDQAKAQLRVIQDKWETAGKVPRGDIDRVEKGLRRIESAVREAEDKKWQRTNPEVAARASSLVGQLQDKVAKLEKQIESADDNKRARLQSELESAQSLLKMAQAGLDEFGG
ncbi:DUF349 domain-containing protein [Actinomycetota bacterium]